MIEQDGTGGPLLDRHVAFVHALREAGLPVSLAEGLDAAKALTVIDLAERETLREAYAATLVKRLQHRPGFDALFDLWFPPVISDGYGTARPAPGGGPAERPPPLEPSEASAPPDPSELAELRERLADLLMGDPDDPAFRAFARSMVERFGKVRAAGNRQSWFSYPVLRALSPQTLIARMLDRLLAEQGRAERGGLPEKLARHQISRNIRKFEEAVASDVRRRIAEESGTEKIAKATVAPPIDRVDFLRMTKDELARLRREVYPLARRLATRLTVKQKRGHRGRLDFRRTVRASLSTGGVPLTTHLRPRRPHKPELVILCDASDSVAAFSHFTLLLTFALREQFTKVRAFAFVDIVDEITTLFHPGADVLDAVLRLTKEADITRFGRTNYGHVFTSFAERYGDAIGPRTSLLILGDARSNYQPPALETLGRLAGEARHAYWLNPEPRPQWDTGDSVATSYAGIVPMHECRNVTQLAAFIEDLA
ncbi:VWA domain-containing protein [Microtetraspora sp. AC03309]|uniref:vWA domain-containing protein n=1 Tax=Microtetraspora sp. AC03309 TaxID=2779376 RepID=UPI001E2D47AD|nr:VWA domain-containing protein [Microtetraspora sp. AC03309]MCC5579222.1 VWA domain-containing protein [Microtetraspora sp. AC03309]